jgi:hypothetical protein
LAKFDEVPGIFIKILENFLTENISKYFNISKYTCTWQKHLKTSQNLHGPTRCFRRDWVRSYINYEEISENFDIHEDVLIYHYDLAPDTFQTAHAF